MLRLLNRHLVLPLIARKRGSRHLEYLRFLERGQFDAPELIAARQLIMLQGQLRHAWETVPYYRERWALLGLHPDAVKSIADLAQFPVLTKADIRAHPASLVSTAFRDQPLRQKTTSGSTGVPLRIQMSESAVQWKLACTLRADQWSGYRLGERVAKVWGNPEYLHWGRKGKLVNRFVDRATHLDTIGLDAAKLSRFAEELRRRPPGLLFGHAHSLYLLAAHLKKAGISDIRPGGIVSTAMPLHDWQRAVIEAVFGIAATDRYGCEELSLIASQCEKHGGMHVAAESVLTEVEANGHLLVTDLSNPAMPLIRYRVGDVVTPADGPCSCGRGLPLLGRVTGRDADFVLTPAGGLISGISLTENFAVLITGAAQVQLIQEEQTHLTVRMVPGDDFGNESRAQIARLVAETFGPTMRHTIDLVGAIPQEPGGKYRFCVSPVARAHLRELSA